MGIGIRGIINIIRLHYGQQKLPTLLLHHYDEWPKWKKSCYKNLIGCHISRMLEFNVALICWLFLFPKTFSEAKEWHLYWVLKVILFNLICEFTICGFWHWLTYESIYSKGKFKEKKFNPINPYECHDGKNEHLLQREILISTLGWLHSAMIQCTMMWLWASGRVQYYAEFWKYPLYSIFLLLLITYWRQFHFYWSHRVIHPWWNIKYGLKDGDIGAVFYKHFHSLHHKSYNPGPWSGLSMHPVEHFIYYTCTYFPLLFSCHPLHFLYAKFHADISPIGGHDGYADPGGDSSFHYLHHAKFNCNYGSTLINFDQLFGTYVDYNDYKNSVSNKTQKIQEK
ncbi:unnamed protein product [Rotaria sp. Silwood1]|nr:unnamed protein product [Rotaria sp. Silwood1]CAF1613765.1 unnamed protein product [Rotaria sp. Silwood1]